MVYCAADGDEIIPEQFPLSQKNLCYSIQKNIGRKWVYRAEGVFQHFYICFILGVYKFGRATLCFFSRNKIFSCRFNLFQACACRYSQIHILFHVILNGVYIQCSISSVSYQYVTIKSTATNQVLKLIFFEYYCQELLHNYTHQQSQNVS